MAASLLPVWLIGAPLVLAIIDLMRTGAVRSHDDHRHRHVPQASPVSESAVTRPAM